MDLRFPIGLLFVLFGAVLIVYGLATPPALYAKSLGLNVNLIWGLVMLAVGALMLLFACRALVFLRKNGK